MSTIERLFEIRGFEELSRWLDEAGRLNEKVYFPLHDAMSQAVQMIEGAAKDRAPVGVTGQLRASIGSVVDVNEAAVEGKVGTNLGIGEGSGYAQAVEPGTRPHWPGVSLSGRGEGTTRYLKPEAEDL